MLGVGFSSILFLTYCRWWRVCVCVCVCVCVRACAVQVGFNHDLKLRSCYNGELPYTNYTADFKGIIDYIFYSTDGMAPIKVLGPHPDDVMSSFDGCPNPHFPSDHLPLFAEMALSRRASEASS